MKGIVQMLFALLMISSAFVLVAALSLRFNIIRNVNVQFDIDASQSTLLTLLSVTDKGVPGIEVVGESVVLKNSDAGFVKSSLEKLFPSKCYSLDAQSLKDPIAAKEKCTTPDRKATTRIPLPYDPNKLVETVTLAIQ